MKNDENKKNVSLSIKINHRLYDELIEFKEKNKINLSEFIRSIIADRLEYLKRKKKTWGLKEIW